LPDHAIEDAHRASVLRDALDDQIAGRGRRIPDDDRGPEPGLSRDETRFGRAMKLDQHLARADFVADAPAQHETSRRIDRVLLPRAARAEVDRGEADELRVEVSEDAGMRRPHLAPEPRLRKAPGIVHHARVAALRLD